MPASYADDRTLENGAVYRWCHVCDLWKLKDSEHFQKVPSRNGWARMCKECRSLRYNSRRNPHLEVHGVVPVTKVRPMLKQMIGTIGWTKTAERIGCTSTTLSRWLGTGKTPQGQPPLRVQRKSAAKIIRAAIQLRADVASGKITPLKVHHSSQNCKGCGGDLETYMDGCGVCWERRRGRERRLDADYRKQEAIRYANKRRAA